MQDYQIEAIKKVREYAITSSNEHKALVEKTCNPFDIDIISLVNQILKRPVTINFHPDRFSNNGKTIIENLVADGEYYSQFRTGTTNGGRTAHEGGDRFLWEQRIFFNAYPQSSIDRPKYGALNLLKYTDGASMRFGSCFLALKHEVVDRCTFAYGDSSSNPSILCTGDTFVGVLGGLFEDFHNKGRLLNQVVTWTEEVLAILLNPCKKMNGLGRNLDYCIEAHVHGDILLDRDVDSFYVDESFQNTFIGEQAEDMCRKYGITLCWIPKRQVSVDAIGSLFRGRMVPVLAQRIDAALGNKQGFINAELIGRAARDIHMHPQTWLDIGSEPELFQYIKQLWHTVGYFG